ncbi:hypothetical protein DFH29DRAFT_178060 [Suillus ampliporus]|nr:hypothetical protein DFH29DRAFT_178060 [Suillus ampliporus]
MPSRPCSTMSTFLKEPTAERLSVLAKKFAHAQFGDEILREIAGKTFSAQHRARRSPVLGQVQ